MYLYCQSGHSKLFSGFSFWISIDNGICIGIYKGYLRKFEGTLQ